MSSIRHKDYTGGELLTAGGKEPTILHGPGEYEIGGLSVSGIEGESEYDDEYHINTIYTFRMQGMDVCFIGPVKDRELPAGADQIRESTDILFVPITGEATLSPADAHKLAVQIEPSIVIPTHFTDPDDEAIDNFVSEANQGEAERNQKLTLTPRDLSGRDTDIEVIVPES
jgi:L-ascorbate metabolism protein UlaG (beta-lactamase superfamily)